MSAGQFVVADNTNPSAEVRSLYLSLARTLQKLTNGEHKHVPCIAYSMSRKNWQKPEIKEEFKEIKVRGKDTEWDGRTGTQRTQRANLVSNAGGLSLLLFGVASLPPDSLLR